METIIDLAAVESWRQALGLLAVPLLHGEHDRFVMLNGTRGNFCLDFSASVDPGFARSTAWSTDVGHYVHVNASRQAVVVQRWDRSRNDLRAFPIGEVAEDLPRFQRYLEQHDPDDRDRSIVGFITRLYATLRAVFGSEHFAGESLRAFLFLLAVTASDDDNNQVDLPSWGVPEDARTIAERIPQDQWRALVDELRIGRKTEALQPRLDLVLRHAAGQIFQEAHYIAQVGFEDQLLLPSMLPVPAKTSASTSATGVYFTPPYLARTLVEQTIMLLDINDEEVTIFDPACGSGEILREVVRQFEQRDYRGRVRLIGWDKSPIARDMARFTLHWERQSTNLDLEVTIECHDSVADAASWPTNVDAIIMNPPFVSYEFLDSGRRSEMKVLLGDMLGQRPDIASAFLYLAASAIKKGGAIASIIPSSLLDNESTRKLREHLSTTLKPAFIAKLGDMTLFRKALVDAGMYVGRAGDVQQGRMLWTAPTKPAVSTALRMLRRYDGAVTSSQLYSIYPIEKARWTDESWSPRPYESLERLRRYTKNIKATVSGTFDVKQGVRTGERKLFVLDDSQFSALPKAEQKYFRDAIINRSIVDGRITSVAHLFYPYGESEIGSEDELRRLVRTYADAFLFPNKDLLQQRKKTNRDKWWKLTWPRKGDVHKKILSKDFGREKPFAFDDRGDRLVISGYAWYPKRQDYFTDEIAFAYLAILDSPEFQDLLGATSRQVSGGQWYMQTRFVDDLPLPQVDGARFSRELREGLARIGAAIHVGANYDASEWRLLVEAAYEPL